MKFSVIIGLYNHLKYIPKLLESLEKQTFQDFEIHFCDDASTDGTKEFFNAIEKGDKWQYHRLSGWFKRSSRLAKSLNQGIRKAKGEYCVFIMGDSFPEMNYLEILNDWVKEDRVLCGIRANIDGNKLVELDYRIRKEVIPQEAVLLPSNPYNMITGNGLSVPTKALGRGWDTRFEGYGGDDNEVAARLYYKGYLFYSIPQAILYHNWHKSGETKQATLNLINKIIYNYAC